MLTVQIDTTADDSQFFELLRAALLRAPEVRSVTRLDASAPAFVNLDGVRYRSTGKARDGFHEYRSPTGETAIYDGRTFRQGELPTAWTIGER